MLKLDESKHYIQIDIIKGLAIIAVITLHVLPGNLAKIPLSIFTIEQAVPIFLVIMGLNAAMSFKRRGYINLSQIYNTSYIKSRFKRLLYPFIFIFILSAILGLIFKGNIYMGFLSILGYLPLSGPGNYFVSIVFQFVFTFPILYCLYKKNPKFTLVLSFVLTFVFEILANQIPVLENNSYLYKACILRYLFIIALGVWTLDNFDINSLKTVFKRKLIIVGLIVSVVYMVSISVFNWNFIHFQAAWQPRNVLSFFYPLTIFLVGLRYLPLVSEKISGLFGFIGRASYHIFLVQIIVFGAGLSMASTIEEFGLQHIYGVTSLISNIIIMTVLGSLFFILEIKFKEYISKKIIQKPIFDISKIFH